jgi:sentrin-specific protease 1
MHVGNISRNPILRRVDHPYLSTDIDQLSLEGLNEFYCELGKRVPRKQIVAEYIGRDTERAVRLLDTLESSKGWGDCRFYKNVCTAVVANLRIYLAEQGHIRTHASDWVDPFADRFLFPKSVVERAVDVDVLSRTDSKVVKNQNQLGAVAKGSGSFVTPSVLPRDPNSRLPPPAQIPSKKRNNRRARAARTKLRRAMKKVKMTTPPNENAMDTGSETDLEPPERRVLFVSPSLESITSDYMFTDSDGRFSTDTWETSAPMSTPTTPPPAPAHEPASAMLNTPEFKPCQSPPLIDLEDTPFDPTPLLQPTSSCTLHFASASPILPPREEPPTATPVSKLILPTPISQPTTPRPAVTESMRQSVRRRMRRPAAEVIAKCGANIDVTTTSLRTLKNEEWLAGEIVDFYAKLLNERTFVCPVPGTRIHVLSAAETANIMMNGTPEPPGGRNTLTIDPFTFDVLLFLTNIKNNHWVLCVADHRTKTLSYLDSMLPEGDRSMVGHQQLARIQYYLEIEHVKRRGCSAGGYQREIRADIEQQVGEVDCGIFMCTFAERICRGAAFDFSQKDIPNLRELMAYEVIHGRVLV